MRKGLLMGIGRRVGREEGLRLLLHALCSPGIEHLSHELHPFWRCAREVVLDRLVVEGDEVMLLVVWREGNILPPVLVALEPEQQAMQETYRYRSWCSGLQDLVQSAVVTVELPRQLPVWIQDEPCILGPQGDTGRVFDGLANLVLELRRDAAVYRAMAARSSKVCEAGSESDEARLGCVWERLAPACEIGVVDVKEGLRMDCRPSALGELGDGRGCGHGGGACGRRPFEVVSFRLAARAGARYEGATHRACFPRSSFYIPHTTPARAC